MLHLAVQGLVVHGAVVDADLQVQNLKLVGADCNVVSMRWRPACTRQLLTLTCGVQIGSLVRMSMMTMHCMVGCARGAYAEL